jgi:TolB-like protein
MSEPEPAPAKIFLSYTRADRKRALAVIALLEGAGYEVWWDGLLEGGENYLPITAGALEQADLVVVLWSRIAVDSNWVRDEAGHGRDHSRLVPVSIDGAEPPLGFRQIQVIDLNKWHGNAGDAKAQALLRAVAAQAGRTAPAPAARASLLSRRAVLASGGAALVAAAGIAAWRLDLFGGAASIDNSVAVLSFRNLSGSADEDYLAEGLAEELRAALARNPALKVLAQASTAAASKGELEPGEIARKLQVRYLLGGSVRREGKQLRIAANLTDAATGFTSWSEQFDRELSDVFALQEDIAGQIAAAMAAQASPGSASSGSANRVAGSGTASAAALDAYLRGNAFYQLRSGESSLRAALGQYALAVAADPGFAQAHAARARIVLWLAQAYGRASELPAAFADAIAGARRAVELAPGLAICQVTLGYVLIGARLDFTAARAPFAKARELGWGDAWVMLLYASWCAQTGRSGEAVKAMARALELDPLNPGAYRVQAYVSNFAHDWTGAEAACRRALELNPQISSVQAYLGDALLQQGQLAEARAAYDAETVELFRLTGLAIADHKLGNGAAAQASYDKLVTTIDGSVYQQAQILAQWGQADKALERLAFARKIGDSGLVHLKVDPLLDPLRARDEFNQLLAALKVA